MRELTIMLIFIGKNQVSLSFSSLIFLYDEFLFWGFQFFEHIQSFTNVA